MMPQISQVISISAYLLCSKSHVVAVAEEKVEIIQVAVVMAEMDQKAVAIHILARAENSQYRAQLKYQEYLATTHLLNH